MMKKMLDVDVVQIQNLNLNENDGLVNLAVDDQTFSCWALDAMILMEIQHQWGWDWDWLPIDHGYSKIDAAILIDGGNCWKVNLVADP